ncbi:MAG: hypothetical protein ACP5NX_02830 [Candidatus Bilamarchaeaceae archaeon]
MLSIRWLLIGAALLGFFFPMWEGALDDTIVYFLAGSVLFSMVASKHELKLTADGIKKGLFYGYIVFTIPMVLVALLLLPTGVKEGFIMYAISTPAVGLIVLSRNWGGKPGEVFMFSLLSYMASLVFIPLAAYLLIGHDVDVWTLVKYLLLIFAVPVGASMFIKVKESWKHPMLDISNILLALVFYASVAISRDAIILNWEQLSLYMLGFFFITLAGSYFVFWTTKDPDAVLYSFMKNGGAAVALSISFLAPLAVAVISTRIMADALLIAVFGRVFEK